MHRIITILLLLACCLPCRAQSVDSLYVQGADTTRYRYTPMEQNEMVTVLQQTETQPADTIVQQKKKRKGFKEYFSSRDKTFEKKLDFSVLGGLFYNSTTKAAVALVGTGQYRLDRTDRTLQPSYFSVYGMVSYILYYRLGLDGLTIFKGDRNRLQYDLYFANLPTSFWGAGYTNGCNPENHSEYKKRSIFATAKYLRKVYDGVYLGTRLQFNWDRASQRDDEIYDDPEYSLSSVTSCGISAIFEYDTRDVITAPEKGVYLSLEAMFRPKFMTSFKRSTFTFKGEFRGYHKAWRSALIAYQFYYEMNSKSTPWLLYANMGSSSRMRGYYESRFCDNSALTLQAELRQKLSKRFRLAVWAGAGNVFGPERSFSIRHTLPNYGLGIRWELKPRSSIRFDYGFGAKCGGRLINGFAFSMNEAF